MILIVDDQRDVCRAAEVLLSGIGLPAKCVSDPAAALAAIEAEEPSCIVLGDALPGVTCIEVLKEIRAKLGDSVPVVMFCGRSDTFICRQALDLGAIEWVRKHEPQTLVEVVAATLRQAASSAGLSPRERG